MTFIAFVIYFTIANLFSGGKFKGILRQHNGPLPGRGIYYAGALTMLLGWLLYSLPGLLVGFSFLLWRLPGWYGAIDAGLDKHSRLRDFLVMSARGLVAAPVFAYIFYTGGGDWKVPAILFAASLGQGLAYDVAGHTFMRNFWIAEGLSGAIWGIAYWLLIN